MGKILIVEDNPQDARLTMKAMQANGMASLVEMFGDGESLIDYLDTRRKTGNGNCCAGFSMLLLDLNLPGIQGLEVLHFIRETRCSQYLPVIAFTTEDSPQRVQECYAAGVNSFITKSIDFEEFVRAVGQVVDYWVGLNKSVE